MVGHTIELSNCTAGESVVARARALQLAQRCSALPWRRGPATAVL
eukprot:SAG31_NODE_16056_length_725_cov_0.846645_1_plen_44_part_10